MKSSETIKNSSLIPEVSINELLNISEEKLQFKNFKEYLEQTEQKISQIIEFIEKQNSKDAKQLLANILLRDKTIVSLDTEFEKNVLNYSHEFFDEKDAMIHDIRLKFYNYRELQLTALESALSEIVNEIDSDRFSDSVIQENAKAINDIIKQTQEIEKILISKPPDYGYKAQSRHIVDMIHSLVNSIHDKKKYDVYFNYTTNFATPIKIEDIQSYTNVVIRDVDDRKLFRNTKKLYGFPTNEWRFQWIYFPEEAFTKNTQWHITGIKKKWRWYEDGKEWNGEVRYLDKDPKTGEDKFLSENVFNSAKNRPPQYSSPKIQEIEIKNYKIVNGYFLREENEKGGFEPVEQKVYDYSQTLPNNPAVKIFLEKGFILMGDRSGTSFGIENMDIFPAETKTKDNTTINDKITRVDGWYRWPAYINKKSNEMFKFEEKYKATKPEDCIKEIHYEKREFLQNINIFWNKWMLVLTKKIIFDGNTTEETEEINIIPYQTEHLFNKYGDFMRIEQKPINLSKTEDNIICEIEWISLDKDSKRPDTVLILKPWEKIPQEYKNQKILHSQKISRNTKTEMFESTNYKIH